MPTYTFFNLPKEKQDRIIQATLNEIRKNNYDDISINQIVKNAKISRGSFYDYFESKEDLILYILKNIKDKIKRNFENIDNLSFDKVIENLIYQSITSSENYSNGCIYKNIFGNHNKIFSYLLDLDDEILTCIVNDPKVQCDYEILLFLLNDLIKSTIVKIHIHYDNRYDEFEKFKQKLHIIKLGAYTKDKENNND